MALRIYSFARHIPRLSAFWEKSIKNEPHAFHAQLEWNQEGSQHPLA